MKTVIVMFGLILLIFTFFNFARMFIHADEIELCFKGNKTFIPEGVKVTTETDDYVCWVAKYKGQDFFGRYFRIEADGKEIWIPVDSPSMIALHYLK